MAVCQVTHGHIVGFVDPDLGRALLAFLAGTAPVPGTLVVSCVGVPAKLEEVTTLKGLQKGAA